MRQADEFWASEHLLPLAASDPDSRFRRWFCRQFIDQADGLPVQPWDGPLVP